MRFPCALLLPGSGNWQPSGLLIRHGVGSNPTPGVRRRHGEAAPRQFRELDQARCEPGVSDFSVPWCN